MTEEKKANEETKSDSSCCHTSGSSSGQGSCCSAKKFLIGLIAGMLLMAVAFGLCSSGKCPMAKICPVGQPQTQK